RVALARVQVRTYLMDYDDKRTYVYVLECEGKGNKTDRDLSAPTKADKDPGGKKLRQTPIDRVKDSDVLATQVQPTRMAIVAGAFPYKKQVEEFRSRLGLRSDEEVLAEQAQEKDRDGRARPAFRFLGVIVERRELDADGAPAAGKDGQWRKLDLEKDYG